MDAGQVARSQDGTLGARLAAAYLRVAPGLTIGLLAVGLVRLLVMLQQAAAMPGAIGIDFQAVTDGARRWAATGQPFLDRQLHGPYPHLGWNPSDSGEFLYPPVTLPIFLLFTYLPAIAWWIGPAVLFAVGLLTVRPARWSWPILAGIVGLTNIPVVLIAGNPSLWISGLALLGPITGWTGALVLLKPTFAPIAVLGIWRRSWWIAAAVLLVVCIPFGSLWLDWFHAIRNMQDTAVELPFLQLPIMILPAIAAVAGTAPGLWPESVVTVVDRVLYRVRSSW